LEIVQAFSRCFRGIHLVVLGSMRKNNPYHCAVKAAASAEVKFVGAIYDKEIVEALRYYALFYVHGHQVGGTNPSLVESLGADNAVLAHDNVFNRWVAGEAACYFHDVESCAAHITRLINDADYCLHLQRAARARHTAAFTWESICKQYIQLLKQYLPKR
jgi:glycosyltransferase involved in cell wall biosynthesis